jgi:hypothetical protein
MASEYQKTKIVVRFAEQVFSWVSDVSNLPTTYPWSRKLGSRDPPRRASPERRSGCPWGSPIARRPRARATSTSTKARPHGTGAEMGRDYSGRLSVSDCAIPRDVIVPQAPLWVSARLALTEYISPAFREAPVLTESLYAAFLDARRCSSR